jgi:type IV pilus assembly protein PilC
VSTPAGEVFWKTLAAADEAALRRDLESQDLLLLDVRRSNPMVRQLAQALRFKSPVSSREFLFFNQELRALVRAGLPIVPSLDVLLERRKNKVFRRALIDVRDRVKGGEALSEAFAAQGDMFPKLYAASLASGERSGELASVLERFVAYMHKLLAVRRKVVSALIYPAILVTLSIVLVALMVFFIIPKFKEFLDDFGAEMPLITKVLVGFSMACRNQWEFILGATVLGIVAAVSYAKSPAGRVALDRLKLRIPIVGGVVQNYAQNRFTRTLGTLQAGGIPLVTSLELSARAVGNAVFEAALLGVAERVREGAPLWESLDNTGLMSDLTIQMIKVGESTGALDEMLKNASDFTDEEIDAKLTRLVTLIEPLMLVFMAVVVATMLLAVYLPLLQAYGQQA